MTHHHRLARPPLDITRGFERSRIEDRMVTAAYELAVPLVRRLLSSSWHADRLEMAGGKGGEEQRHRNAGGITA
jgi:hypothetical protein